MQEVKVLNIELKSKPELLKEKLIVKSYDNLPIYQLSGVCHELEFKILASASELIFYVRRQILKRTHIVRLLGLFVETESDDEWYVTKEGLLYLLEIYNWSKNTPYFKKEDWLKVIG